MKRRAHKPSAISKVYDKSRASDEPSPDKAPASEMSDPLVTFLEWSSEADEKAYADIIQQNPNMVDDVYDFRNFM